MLSFRNLKNALKSYFTVHLPGVNVELGRYGQVPSMQPPELLIYIEPAVDMRANPANQPVVRCAQINLFACCGGETEADEAAASAVELLEQIESLLIDTGDGKDSFERYLNTECENLNEQYTWIKYTGDPGFDAYYTDIAVANMEIRIPYAKLK